MRSDVETIKKYKKLEARVAKFEMVIITGLMVSPNSIFIKKGNFQGKTVFTADNLDEVEGFVCCMESDAI